MRSFAQLEGAVWVLLFAFFFKIGDAMLFAMGPNFLADLGVGTFTLGVFASSDIVLQNGRVKIVETYFDVSGAVTVGGAEFQPVDCFSIASEIREHFSDPNGPKPSGKTPANKKITFQLIAS